MSYIWHFEVVWQYKDAFVHGLITTIELSFLTIVIALIIGTTLGATRVFFPNKHIRNGIAALIELLRAIPKMVLLIWVFYALPMIGGNDFSAFESALISLSLVSSAFVAEIVRSGIEAIPQGQIEAARIMGMSEFQIITSIILPQVFMKNMPSFMNEFTTAIKDSTLAVMIGVNELLHATSDSAVFSYRPIELYTTLGIIFLLILIPLSLLTKKLEFKDIIKARTR